MRRFEPHRPGLLGDGLDDPVHQAAKVEELTTDDADIDGSYHCNDGRYERPAEDKSERCQCGIAAQQKESQMGQAHCTANAEEPFITPVILATDRDQRTAAKTARDLEVPIAPSRVGRDKIFV